MGSSLELMEVRCFLKWAVDQMLFLIRLKAHVKLTCKQGQVVCFEGALQASLVLSNWLNCSEEMQARHWPDKLRGPLAKLTWPTQVTQVR